MPSWSRPTTSSSSTGMRSALHFQTQPTHNLIKLLNIRAENHRRKVTYVYFFHIQTTSCTSETSVIVCRHDDASQMTSNFNIKQYETNKLTDSSTKTLWIAACHVHCGVSASEVVLGNQTRRKDKTDTICCCCCYYYYYYCWCWWCWWCYCNKGHAGSR
jgi:hypothetical protein